jgi:glutathione S-transferase
MILTFKKIPYETHWVQFSQVEPTAKAIGAPPTGKKADGSGHYTVPFITFESKGKPIVAISDSTLIAEYIEKTYPDPENPLFPAQERVLHAIFSAYLKEKLLPNIGPIHAPELAKALLPEEAKWFAESREAVSGKKFVPPTDEQRGAALAKFEAFFDELSAHLDRTGDGNFRVTGGKVTYAEIELVGYIRTCKAINGQGWASLKTRNGGRFAKLLEIPEYQL